MKRFCSDLASIDNYASLMEDSECGTAQLTLLAQKLLEDLAKLQMTVSQFCTLDSKARSLALFKTYAETLKRVDQVSITMYNSGLRDGSLINVVLALNLKSRAFELAEDSSSNEKETISNNVFGKPNVL